MMGLRDFNQTYKQCSLQLTLTLLIRDYIVPVLNRVTLRYALIHNFDVDAQSPTDRDGFRNSNDTTYLGILMQRLQRFIATLVME